MPKKNANHCDPSLSSSTSPPLQVQPRGFRVPEAAAYSGLSPFGVEELIRAGILPAVGGRDWLKWSPNDVGLSAYVILKEHLDKFLDSLAPIAVDRAVEVARSKRKSKVKVAA